MFWSVFVRLCDEKKQSPSSVAAAIGLSNSIASKWKKTGAVPNGDILVKLAEYFDVTVDYLLGLSEDRKNPVPEDEVDKEILERFANLTPAQQEKVAAFIEGLLAAKE